ncbi:hypothetical protein, conserved [Eimeria acervulina]|uniref:Serine aminopeptidase S33 domain-containing protein n=1 Tax=Eimeria acervulina TaxID=5801 RepID=U6GJY1_EIMAC|nr:hypothetical protein, conserved [Eimeria acervulina]CDI80485.1 hypothetical protein, conserved [Eimeria acervulina]
MGNAASSPLKSSSSSSSSSSSEKNQISKGIISSRSDSSSRLLPALDWEVISSDPLSRSVELRAAKEDKACYPLDGRPEHGQFINSQGLTLHYYIWYPVTSSSSNSSNSTNSSSSKCCCVKKKREDAPAACRLSGTPNFPFTSSRSAQQQQQQQQDEQDVVEELCVHCKREAAKNSRGVVLLLHGYQSHSRFSWLRRYSASPSVRRDPRIHGYTPHSALDKQLLQQQQQQKEQQQEQQKHQEEEKDVGEQKTSQEQPIAVRAAGSTAAAAAGAAAGCGCVGCLGTPQYRGSIVESLNLSGFIVCCLDMQSHGLSEGWGGCRCAVRELEDLALDALQMLLVLKRKMLLLRSSSTSSSSSRSGGVEVPAQPTKEEQQLAATNEQQEQNAKESKQDEEDERQNKQKDEQDGEEDKQNAKEEDKLCLLPIDSSFPFFIVGSSLGGWTAARCMETSQDTALLLNTFPELAAAVAAAASGQPAVAAAAAAESAAAGATGGGATGGAAEGTQVCAASDACRLIREYFFLRGAVLLSPMFDVEEAKRNVRWTYTRPLVQQLARWLPHMQITRNKLETKFETETEHRRRDPLYIHHGTRANTALQLLGKAELPIHPEETAKINEKCCKSLLVVHNALDEQCGIRGALSFYKGLSGVIDKTLIAVNAVPPSSSNAQAEPAAGASAAAAAAAEADMARSEEEFRQKVPLELQQELQQQHADLSLNGLDVHHSFASETDGDLILAKVVQWIDARAP